MTTPAAEPTPPANQPTPAQSAALGQEAVAAATAPGQTPEQRQQATEAAIGQQAQQLNLKISDEDKRSIAEMTIKMLEEAGAFDQPPAAPAQTSPAPGAEGQAATAGAGGTPTPPAPAPAPGDPGEPRRRSFAERFQGKS